MLKNDLYSWLIPYLEGDLDPKRKAAVEARIGIDAEYAAEAARLRNVLRHVHELGASTPQSEPEFSIWPKVQSQLRAHPGQSRWSSRLSLVGGAAAVVLVGVAIAHPWDGGNTRRHPGMVASGAHGPAVAGLIEPPKLDGIQNQIVKTADNLRNAYTVDGNRKVPVTGNAEPVYAVPQPADDRDVYGQFGSGAQVKPDADPFRYHPVIVSVRPETPRKAPRTRHFPARNNVGPLPLRGGIVVAEAGSGHVLSDSVVPGRLEMMRDRLTPSESDALVDPVTEVTRGAGNGYAVNADNGITMSGGGTAPRYHSERIDFGNLPPHADLNSKAFAGGFGGSGPGRGMRNLTALSSGLTDGQQLRSLLYTASMHANRGDVDGAMDFWRDALMFELQPPTYADETASTQALSILETIRKTGNLVPFRAFVEHQATPTPDEVADWRILGLLYGKQGNNALALAAWEYVARSGLATGEDWFQLATVRQGLGDSAGARSAFTHAVSGLAEGTAHRAAARQALSRR